MIAYLDSSALVKAYVEEQESDKVDAVLNSEALVASSCVAYAGVVAALHRRARKGDIGAANLAQALAEFHEDWPQFLPVEVGQALTPHVDRIAASYDLRGFDVIHLASAVLLAQTGRDLEFWSFDRRLVDAAAATGLVIRP